MGDRENDALIEGGLVETDYAEYFAGRLREALGAMQQTELIKLIKQNGFEMQQQRLSHYFQGRNYPDPPVLKELVKALGISADWLLGLTEQPLPAADLDEMAAQARGEGRINRILKNLPKDKQQQVIQFAEYLLSRQPLSQSDDTAAGSDEAVLNESRRIASEARQWLDSIQRTRDLKTRQEIEKIFRDKNLFVGDSTT